MLTPLVLFKEMLFAEDGTQSEEKCEKYMVSLAYLPKEGNFADVNDVKSKITELLKNKKEKEIWLEKIAQELLEWFNKKYKNKGAYLLMEDYQEEVQVNLVSGEMEKDWDVKLEVLMSLKL